MIVLDKPTIHVCISLMYKGETQLLYGGDRVTRVTCPIRIHHCWDLELFRRVRLRWRSMVFILYTHGGLEKRCIWSDLRYRENGFEVLIVGVREDVWDTLG